MDPQDMSEMDEGGDSSETGSDQDTLFIPKDQLSHDCKPGDKIEFEVVGEDEDGDVEVKMTGYEPGKSEDMSSELRRTFAGKDSTPGYE